MGKAFVATGESEFIADLCEHEGVGKACARCKAGLDEVIEGHKDWLTHELIFLTCNCSAMFSSAFLPPHAKSCPAYEIREFRTRQKEET